PEVGDLRRSRRAGRAGARMTAPQPIDPPLVGSWTKYEPDMTSPTGQPVVRATGQYEVEVSVTVKMKVDAMAMFMVTPGVEVKSGPYEGTECVANVAGGTPILYVKKGDKTTTCWLPVQGLIGAMLEAVEPLLDDPRLTR